MSDVHILSISFIIPWTEHIEFAKKFVTLSRRHSKVYKWNAWRAESISLCPSFCLAVSLHILIRVFLRYRSEISNAHLSKPPISDKYTKYRRSTELLTYLSCLLPDLSHCICRSSIETFCNRHSFVKAKYIKGRKFSKLYRVRWVVAFGSHTFSATRINSGNWH